MHPGLCLGLIHCGWGVVPAHRPRSLELAQNTALVLGEEVGWTMGQWLPLHPPSPPCCTLGKNGTHLPFKVH